MSVIINMTNALIIIGLMLVMTVATVVEEKSKAELLEKLFDSLNSSKVDKSEKRNFVHSEIVLDLSPWLPSNWKPAPRTRQAKVLETRRNRLNVSTSTFKSAETSKPFVGSPRLSAEGWMPVSKKNRVRQPKARPVELDYDDIITAPPFRSLDNFEISVGASMNDGGGRQVKFVNPTARRRRSAGPGAPFSAPRRFDEFDDDLVYDTSVYYPKTSVGFDKYITRQPVSVRYDLWPKSVPEPTLVYIPLRRLGPIPTNPTLADKTSTKNSANRNWSANKISDKPMSNLEPPTSRQEVVDDESTIFVGISTPASKRETILDAQPIMNAPYTPYNTHRGPYTVRAYTTTKFDNVPDTTLYPYVDATMKNLVGARDNRNEVDAILTESNGENNNGDNGERTVYLSATSLTYILIGACSGLIVVFGTIVLVTMRCRQRRRKFGNSHVELINGWESVSKPSQLAFEEAANLDPWFDKKPILAARLSADEGNASMVDGVRFETLGIGPIKEIKRTTVIPARGTAFVTDGHTAAMRELSSVSSGSVNSRRSLCNLPSFLDAELDAPESLDIPVDLFDRKGSKDEAKTHNNEEDAILWTSNDERLI